MDDARPTVNIVSSTTGALEQHSVKSLPDLRVWQGSMELVEEIYRVTAGLPQHEIYGLTNQLRRAAVSVPSNIAEGHAREHTKDYLHHVSMAQASLAEVETQLEIAVRLKYLCSQKFKALLDESTALGKQLYALRNALNRKK
jgi:four helix bundle protein